MKYETVLTMIDNRITDLYLADYIARKHKLLPLFIFRSGIGKAVYVFGLRVYSRGWL